MSSKEGFSAANVVNLGRFGSPSATAVRPLKAATRVFASRPSARTQHTFAADVSSRHSTYHARADETLTQKDFLQLIQREKRRAERSRAALSLVLYQLDDKSEQCALHADTLVELLQRLKRETDTVGRCANNMIAVLCPDTDEQGTTSFMRKIDAQSTSMPFTAVASTYPDDLVENLAAGAAPQTAFTPFLVSDDATRGGRAYSLKRCLDLAGAIFAIGLFAPLMLLVAAAVGATSRGPIIFRQTRLGKDGVPFTFYKFRSMAIDRDDSVHREFVSNLIKGDAQPNTAPGGGVPAPFKLQSDPRITPFGRFIRKTSIDELPQLFNVLKGDMSLVGPRPPIPYEAGQYQSWHLRRIVSIKPGITGLWQVEGRSKVSFNDMVRMDLRYIRDCSLALDLRILLKTLLVVTRCDGAR